MEAQKVALKVAKIVNGEKVIENGEVVKVTGFPITTADIVYIEGEDHFIPLTEELDLFNNKLEDFNEKVEGIDTILEYILGIGEQVSIVPFNFSGEEHIMLDKPFYSNPTNLSGDFAFIIDSQLNVYEKNTNLLNYPEEMFLNIGAEINTPDENALVHAVEFMFFNEPISTDYLLDYIRNKIIENGFPIEVNFKPEGYINIDNIQGIMYDITMYEEGLNTIINIYILTNLQEEKVGNIYTFELEFINLIEPTEIIEQTLVLEKQGGN